MAGSNGRSSIWAFVIFEESRKPGTFEFLSKLQLPVFISPVHDRDLWTYEDSIDNYMHTGLALPVGSPKKPHRHYMIKFSSNKSMSYVLAALSPLGVKYVLQLGTCAKSLGQSWRGYARYLCHLDNPEKAQYDPALVLSFGGNSYFRDAAVSPSASRAWDCAPIFDFINANEITSYQVLLDYCLLHRPDWYPTVFLHATKFQQYMKSFTWTLRHFGDDVPLLPDPVSITTPTQGEGIKSFSALLGGDVL